MIFRYAFEKLFKAREAASRARGGGSKAGADSGYDPYEKPFLDHLEDLRKTLGKMLVFLVVITMFAFIVHLPIGIHYPIRQRPDIARSNWLIVYSCNRHDAPGSRGYEDLVSGFKLVDSNDLCMTSNF